ncbi:TPA: LOW QUALITY PROTEIN: hypothetical protein N0F65_004323, partial [Lagenidium giganteum]
PLAVKFTPRREYVLAPSEGDDDNKMKGLYMALKYDPTRLGISLFNGRNNFDLWQLNVSIVLHCEKIMPIIKEIETMSPDWPRTRPGSYVGSIRRWQDERRNEAPLPDEERAQMMITNAGGLYPDLPWEQTDLIRPNRPWSLREAQLRFKAAERHRNAFQQADRGKHRDHRSTRQQHNSDRGEKAAPGRSKSKVNHRKGKSKRQVELDETDDDDEPPQKTRRLGSDIRHDSLADVKKRIRCNKSRQVGHWASECPENSDSSEEDSGRATAILGMVLSKPTASLGSEMIEWVLDRGSQVNTCRDFTCFVETRSSVSRELRMANSALQAVDMEGDMQITVVNEWNQLKEDRLIEQVLYVLTAAANLLSIDHMQRFGIFSKDQKTCWLTKPKLKLQLDKVDGIYRMETPRQDSSVWHGHFCHANMHLSRTDSVMLRDHDLQVTTVPCTLAMMKRMMYPRRQSYAKIPLERLSTDICTITVRAMRKAAMFQLIVDECTRFKWVFLRQRKHKAAQHILDFVTRLHVEHQSHHTRRVSVIHIYQGGDFTSATLRTFCLDDGIKSEFTQAYSPQETGIVRAMLSATQLPDVLLGKAHQHVAYTENLMPTQSLTKKSRSRACTDDRTNSTPLRARSAYCSC